ncbi:cytochrome c oxidase protein 20-like [Scleropages formosus]|uniref:Cytochrome c oxidase assembly protein COX20, mitochondrial n=1 Tax=Scleropages formosus TaxID=113540 RepID=A0A0P7TST6_SCLFO|nr:cytochrome c oxidase assembly protein COX20, mitochondrial [Scleropages formosus]KPP64308.1 cytochrome c oxidase protein 20-like [Scleropages formosus]
MTEEKDSDERKSFKLLGILDVGRIPCAREAVLHGAGGALVAGLGHFLLTSRVKRSFDVGMAGYIVTTLGSWVYCRYNNAKLRIQQRVIQDALQNKVLYEGTNRDPSKKLNGSSSGAPD